jgi:hypothetical protein
VLAPSTCFAAIPLRQEVCVLLLRLPLFQRSGWCVRFGLLSFSFVRVPAAALFPSTSDSLGIASCCLGLTHTTTASIADIGTGAIASRRRVCSFGSLLPFPLGRILNTCWHLPSVYLTPHYPSSESAPWLKLRALVVLLRRTRTRTRDGLLQRLRKDLTSRGFWQSSRPGSLYCSLSHTRVQALATTLQPVSCLTSTMHHHPPVLLGPSKTSH